MSSVLKWMALPFSALGALLLFFFRPRSTDKEQLARVHQRAQDAACGAITTGADLDKERVNSETKKKLADNDALSDADIIAKAVSEYRTR